MPFIVLSLLHGCALPVDLSGTGRATLHAQDYVVDTPRIVAVRARQEEADGPFEIEPLVVGGELDLSFHVCGFETEQATFDENVICLDDPGLYVEIDTNWDPPLDDWACVDYPLEYWDGESYDWNALYEDNNYSFGDDDRPGEGCDGWYSLLVTGERDDHVTRFVQNIIVSKTRVPGYDSAPEPLPIALSATGDWRPGSRVELNVTSDETDNPDASFSTVHWWITGGELEQSGRTSLLPQSDSERLHTHNTLVVPDANEVTVAVVVYLDGWSPGESVSWTTQTFEISP